MGYAGKIDKSRRTKQVVFEETIRVINTGLEMQEIIEEIREQSQVEAYKHLNLRIGIHSGKVVAGIIGSRVVRYDIYGEGVLIANKIEQKAPKGELCISDSTRDLLLKTPHSVIDVARDYEIEFYKAVYVSGLNRF